MTVPPHLPPPTCDVRQHRQWQSIKIVVVATFFGLLAGTAGAALVVMNFAQNITLGTNWVITTRPSSILPILEPSVVKRIAGTTFSIYSKASVVGGVHYFDPNDRLSDGVVGVSSGWLLAPLDVYTGTFKDWRIIAADQELYRADRVLYDKRLAIAYIHIVRLAISSQTTQEQFKVAPLSTAVSLPTAVFVSVGGQWLPTTLVSSQIVGQSHLEIVPSEHKQVVGTFASGSLVIDATGNVIGFVRANNQLTPAFAIDPMLTGIDSRTMITYSTWGVEGWYSQEKPLLVNGELHNGFLVTKVLVGSILKRGDIVESVDGRPVDFASVWYTMNAPRSTLLVWRNGTQVSLSIIRQRL